MTRCVLWGVAGFKTDAGALTDAECSDLRAVYGTLGAAWRIPFLSLFERNTIPDILTLDGIFVIEEARGNGVDTALLDAIMQVAEDTRKSGVRLDLIDTNPRAKALYERRGFEATGKQHLGPLEWVFCFASATTMVKWF